MNSSVNPLVCLFVCLLLSRKFYTGINVSDKSEADIVSLFHISETNSYSWWLVNLCWSWDLVWQKLSHSKLSHTFYILYVQSLVTHNQVGKWHKHTHISHSFLVNPAFISLSNCYILPDLSPNSLRYDCNLYVIA